jgi:dethiobiotin synthetase
VVVGTGTEVGKTWVSVHLIGALRAGGWRVESRKPAQSFDPDDPHPTDAVLLAEASGEDPEVVCPPDRSYPVPLAPPMAAEVLGRRVPSVGELVAELRWSGPRPGEQPVVGLVETAGGVRSPFGRDGDAVDFVRILLPEVLVMVAHAGLGTINAVRLTADALAAARGPGAIDPIACAIATGSRRLTAFEWSSCPGMTNSSPPWWVIPFQAAG